MKKLLITLLLGLTLSNTAKTEDIYAITTSSTVEGLNELHTQNPTIDTFDLEFLIKNHDGKIYLHAEIQGFMGSLIMAKSDAYIQTINGETKIYNVKGLTTNPENSLFSQNLNFNSSSTNGKTKAYGSVLQTKDDAFAAGLQIVNYESNNSNSQITGPLYLKIKQLSSEVDGGGQTYFNTDGTDIPLGLTGYKGASTDPNDLYLIVYGS